MVEGAFMNKIERIDRILAGREVDRPPVCLWYHFGVQHGSGEQFARIALDFFDHYDLDFLKVMNDYFYPLPEGLDGISTGADLSHIRPIDIKNSDWARQLKAVEIIAGELHGRAYFLDTIFDPWQTLQRHMAGAGMQALMAEAPEALLASLDVVTDALIDYCRTSIGLGAAGIFMSIPAAAEIVTREQLQAFVLPFARRILEAIDGLGVMNTAHIHGEKLFFDDVLTLPAAVFSWWDRGPNGPSLESVKARIPGCVMGGIDQTLVSRSSPAFLKRHVREGIGLGGSRRFFLAGGCSIPSWTYPGSIRAIVETAKAGTAG